MAQLRNSKRGDAESGQMGKWENIRPRDRKTAQP